jgi:hypothetical protein
MKVKFEAIDFIDKSLLPVFGISGVLDYTSNLRVSPPPENATEVISQFTELVPGIKQYFVARHFSFHTS